MNHAMSLNNKSIIISICLGVLFYVVDSILDFLLFYEDLRFWQVLITDVPIHEIYTRALGICIIVILGIVMPYLLHIPDHLRRSTAQDQQLSTDPTLMVSLSNEIRTPLNAIMGFVDLLKDTRISDTSKRLYLGHIQTSGKYLLELINNITDITLIETGIMYLNEEECKLNQMLSGLHLKLEQQLVEKTEKNLVISLNIGVSDENFTILTDEVRLYQVMVNLIENALRFTDEGIIEFGYNQTETNELEFYVKDSGAGLSPGRLGRLFSKQTSLGTSQMRPFDIIALRVNIVRHLIALFGGELKADSKIGKGSDFRFKLKITPIEVDEEKVTTVEDISERGETTKWESKKVLIAEDVESNFVYLKEILRPTGIQVLWAENGKEAVELCQKHTDVEVVLMDILMPEMDGYEAAKVIKKENPDVPIIAQTAYNIDETEYKDASLYFSKFMIKPIWSIDLLNTLAVYLDQPAKSA